MSLTAICDDVIERALYSYDFYSYYNREIFSKIQMTIPKKMRTVQTLQHLLATEQRYHNRYVPWPWGGHQRLKAVFAWAINYWGIGDKESLFTQLSDSLVKNESYDRYGALLDCFPEKDITKNMATEAVKKNIDELVFVPHRFLTKEFILQVVQDSHGEAYKYIPKEMITREISQAALEESLRHNKSSPFDDIAPDGFNEDMCIQVIRKRPQDIDKVPYKLKTEKVCLEWAVRAMRETALIGWSHQDSQDSLLNKMFSLYVDEGMNDFDEIVRKLREDNVDATSQEFQRKFDLCYYSFVLIPKTHLSICKKMFSLYREKEIPQDIDEMIEILEKMKEHQLNLEEGSLVDKICAAYPELRDKEGISEKNINKLYKNCIDIKEYKFLVGNGKESPLFQSPRFTKDGKNLSSIGVFGRIQEYLGVRNDDSLKLASTGQKKKKRIKKSPTKGEVEKTVWDKIIATGYFIGEKILFSTPFSEKTRTGRVISSIWLVCVFALAVHCQAIIPSVKTPLVLMPLLLYSWCKMFHVIGAWMEFVIPELSDSYCVERAGKEISASEFAKTEEFLGEIVYERQKDLGWESFMSFDEMKKQVEDERHEVLGGQARSALSA